MSTSISSMIPLNQVTLGAHLKHAQNGSNKADEKICTRVNYRARQPDVDRSWLAMSMIYRVMIRVFGIGIPIRKMVYDWSQRDSSRSTMIALTRVTLGRHMISTCSAQHLTQAQKGPNEADESLIDQIKGKTYLLGQEMNFDGKSIDPDWIRELAGEKTKLMRAHYHHAGPVELTVTPILFGNSPIFRLAANEISAREAIARLCIAFTRNIFLDLRMTVVTYVDDLYIAWQWKPKENIRNFYKTDSSSRQRHFINLLIVFLEALWTGDDILKFNNLLSEMQRISDRNMVRVVPLRGRSDPIKDLLGKNKSYENSLRGHCCWERPLFIVMIISDS